MFEKIIVKISGKARLWIILGAAFFVFLLILGVSLYYLSKNLGTKDRQNDFQPDSAAEEDASQLDLVPRLIDGVKVPAGEENLAPWAAMIDNHYDARPPFGLDQAQVVFEAEVEGGMTRLMAVFAAAEAVAAVGPVRSARPYFTDWAAEFSALYAHVGGSPEALAKMAAENILHINEFYNEHSFWRDQARSAPHNVLTSSELMREYLEKNDRGNGRFLSWKFIDDEPNRSISQQKISIPYRRDSFAVDWEYDMTNNNYIRKQGGEYHKTDSGAFITSRNILIIEAEAEEVDEVGRLKISNLGQGNALLCHEGACQPGTWRKISSISRLRVYDDKELELPFLRGNTWVQVVRPETKLSF